MTNKIFHPEYLDYIFNCDGYTATVDAENLIAAGWLIEAGYCWAEDDHDGPLIHLTKAGLKLAEKLDKKRNIGNRKD